MIKQTCCLLVVLAIGELCRDDSCDNVDNVDMIQTKASRFQKATLMKDAKTPEGVLVLPDADEDAESKPEVSIPPNAHNDDAGVVNEPDDHQPDANLADEEDPTPGSSVLKLARKMASQYKASLNMLSKQMGVANTVQKKYAASASKVPFRQRTFMNRWRKTTNFVHQQVKEEQENPAWMNKIGSCNIPQVDGNNVTVDQLGMLEGALVCCLQHGVTDHPDDFGHADYTLILELRQEMWKILENEHFQANLTEDMKELVTLATGESLFACMSSDADQSHHFGDAVSLAQMEARKVQTQQFLAASSALGAQIETKGTSFSHSDFEALYAGPCSVMDCRSPRAALHIMVASRRHAKQLVEEKVPAEILTQHIEALGKMERALPELKNKVINGNAMSMLQFMIGDDVNLTRDEFHAMKEADHRMEIESYVGMLQKSGDKIANAHHCSQPIMQFCISFTNFHEIGCEVSIPIYPNPFTAPPLGPLVPYVGIGVTLSMGGGTSDSVGFETGVSETINAYLAIGVLIPKFGVWMAEFAPSASVGLVLGANIQCTIGTANSCAFTASIGIGVGIAIASPGICPSLGPMLASVQQHSYGMSFICIEQVIGPANGDVMDGEAKVEWDDLGDYVWAVNKDNPAPMGCELDCMYDNENFQAMAAFPTVNGQVDKLKKVDVGDPEVWGISESGKVWRYDNCPKDNGGQIWRRIPVPGGFEPVRDITINSDYRFIVGNNKQVVECEYPCTGHWIRRDHQYITRRRTPYYGAAENGGAIQQISAAQHDLYLIRDNKELYLIHDGGRRRHINSDMEFIGTPGNCIDLVTVGEHRVWIKDCFTHSLWHSETHRRRRRRGDRGEHWGDWEYAAGPYPDIQNMDVGAEHLWFTYQNTLHVGMASGFRRRGLQNRAGMLLSEGATPQTMAVWLGKMDQVSIGFDDH